MEDLRDPAVRALLKAIWTDPASLDPARASARVTRGVAARLAEVSKALETRHPPEDVAHFLMRCIFTMFAEDVDLLPKGKFGALLTDCIASPGAFVPLVEELWAKMDEPLATRRFFSGFRETVRHFNGNLFKHARAFPLGREEIGELLQAAQAKWTEVDPAIFGTLLEQALEPGERRRLGAHYTPRAYVQRLVEVTVMEPLRDDWQKALTKAEDAKESGDEKQALAIIRAFHHRLCATRVLDPACGTGNFLYVALELMKKLEGDVLEALARLGANESLGLERETVDPHQFLGLERNPRAAAIAELVVWIGYLQQHYRTHTGHPAEPILRAFRNINFGRREGFDALLAWDGWPAPTVTERGGERVETFPNARRADWPEAEFIVGNPPFIGNKRMRSRLSNSYVELLRSVAGSVPESADLVMYWWERAARHLHAKDTVLRRFGFVTTNSITMVFNRAIIERFLSQRNPVSIVYSIPDHPWEVGPDGAAVRVAMSVVEAGLSPGKLQTVRNAKSGFPDSDVLEEPILGMIDARLRTGPRLSASRALMSNAGMSFMGVIPVSLRFVLDESELAYLAHAARSETAIVRDYLGGKDLADSRKARKIIDFFGLSEMEARQRFPNAYQHVLQFVKPFRDTVARRNHRENWWLFGEARPGMRASLEGLDHYIGTPETSKHRWFTKIPSNILPDQKIRVVASDDDFLLSILTSRCHVIWAHALGGRVGKGNDPVYNGTVCFDPFPFPDPPDALREKLRAAGEELDGLRKRVLTDHPDLTMTGLYNVLEKLKAGEPVTERDEDIKQRGLVLILKELHETIDRLTAQAYGWPADLVDTQILERLVALNAERAAEEAAGHVRWLRPDFQISRFARETRGRTGELALDATIVSIDAGKPAFPKDRHEQPLAVEAVLASSAAPLDAMAIARAFRGGGRRIEPRVAQVLHTLALYGRASALPNGRFVSRRAA